MADDPANVPSKAPTAPAAAIPKKGKGREAEGEQVAPNHPPVERMISDAIATLNEKGGSSLHAIKKYIADKYKVDVQKLAPYLKRALKKGVELGHLTQPTGKGASGSFKLAVKSEATDQPAVEETRKGEVVVGPGPSKPVKQEVAAQHGTEKESEAPKPGSSTMIKLAKTSEPSSPVKPEGGENEEAVAFPDPNGFLKLLGVDLVMEELLKHLSVRDMKALSSVSKDALKAVRNTKVFAKRVRFRICAASIVSGVLDNCVHSWKSVRINGHRVDSVPAASTVSQSLNAVQSLKIDDLFDWGFSDSTRRKITDFTLSIIQSSKETLEDLNLYIPSSGLSGIESIDCSNLKRLSLVTYGHSNDQVIEALVRNLPPLEELTFRVFSPSYVFAGLQGRVSNLKKLDIAVKRDLDPDWCRTPKAVDVKNVVACMVNLEDLELTLPTACLEVYVQQVEEILQWVPTKTVKKLKIIDTTEDHRDSPNIGEHITRFTNLTELSLLSAQKFEDTHLQGVIRECPKLKKLTLDELKNLTTFGFTGVPIHDLPYFASNEPGVPLSDLRDLTSLTIRDCCSMTLATLLEFIRFELLTSLNLRVVSSDLEARTPRRFLLQILEQNPSLNKIDFHIYFQFDFFCHRNTALEDEVKNLYPRIHHLRFEHSHEYNDDD